LPVYEEGTSHQRSPVGDDDEVMIAVRDGNVARLGELFDRHGNLLYRYFVRLTRDDDGSWDLVQEVFFRVLKYRQSYRAEGKFKSWLFQIAHNVLNSHYQKYRREVPLDADFERPAAEVLPLDGIEAAQQEALLRESLADLPLEKRELLVLSYFERVPYRDIAQMLSCSVGTVKVRVHRAVKELRKIHVQRMKEGKQR